MRPTPRALAPFALPLLLAACGSNTTSGDAAVSGDASTPRDVVIAYDAGNFPTNCGGSFGTCNLVTGAGCTAGQGCYAGRVDGGGVGATCATPASGGWGQPCNTANGCLAGFACLGSPGVCVKLCCADDDASCANTAAGGRAGGVCAGVLTGSDTRLCVQSTACDPRATASNGCPAAQPRCDIITVRGATACSAANADARGDGAACCASAECQVGLVCVGTDGSDCNASAPNRVCRRACDPTNVTTASCPTGQACAIRFLDTPENYGACTPAR
ncbi:MAG: hypothetical protein R3A52_13810 [Polyangiales bacterium]